jgi:hypothetical protein
MNKKWLYIGIPISFLGWYWYARIIFISATEPPLPGSADRLDFLNEKYHSDTWGIFSGYTNVMICAIISLLIASTLIFFVLLKWKKPIYLAILIGINLFMFLHLFNGLRL